MSSNDHRKDVNFYSIPFVVNQFYCIHLVTRCNSNPCRNGGSCVPELTSYFCICDAGYTGTNCENGELCPNNINSTFNLLRV